MPEKKIKQTCLWGPVVVLVWVMLSLTVYVCEISVKETAMQVEIISRILYYFQYGFGRREHLK